MSNKLLKLAPVLIATLTACEQQPVAVPDPASSAAAPSEAVFAQVRAATARYHQVEAAEADGYHLHNPVCLAGPAGGRGYVYANLALNDGVVDPSAPEVLLYEPTQDGGVRLVGVAFVVPPASWVGHSGPPTLGGQAFVVPAPPAPQNYLLTVWAWRHNPDGMFAFFNPGVSCEFAD